MVLWILFTYGIHRHGIKCYHLDHLLYGYSIPTWRTKCFSCILFRFIWPVFVPRKKTHRVKTLRKRFFLMSFETYMQISCMIWLDATQQTKGMIKFPSKHVFIAIYVYYSRRLCLVYRFFVPLDVAVDFWISVVLLKSTSCQTFVTHSRINSNGIKTRMLLSFWRDFGIFYEEDIERHKWSGKIII